MGINKMRQTEYGPPSEIPLLYGEEEKESGGTRDLLRSMNGK
jgi:hypothetical protein